MKQRILDGDKVNADSLVMMNPEFYNAYVLAADYLYKKKEYKKALTYYETALTKEIATIPEKEHIEEQVKKCKTKLE